MRRSNNGPCRRAAGYFDGFLPLSEILWPGGSGERAWPTSRQVRQVAASNDKICWSHGACRRSARLTRSMSAESAQIAIRDVEDRLLQHAQTDPILSRIVSYVPQSCVSRPLHPADVCSMNEQAYLRERETLYFFIGADGSAPSAFTLNRPDFKVRAPRWAVLIVRSSPCCRATSMRQMRRLPARRC